MRRYAITCEFYRTKRAAAIGDCVRKIATEWEHPLSGMWLVKTALSAGEIRSALLALLDFQDRLYICEAGPDKAEFNALHSGGGKVLRIEDARARSRLLTAIFSRTGHGSRHLKAASARSL
jgi:hypothetical protein